MAKTIKRLPKRVNEMAMSMSTGSTAARWFLPGILKRNGKKGLVKQVGDGRVWRRARNRIVAIDHVVDDEDDADRARDDDIGLVFFPSERSDGVFPHSPSEAGLLFLVFFLPFFFSCRLSFYWANFLPRGLGWFQTPWSFCPIFVVDGFQSAVMEICHIKPIDDSLLSSLGSMWSRFFSAFILFL